MRYDRPLNIWPSAYPVDPRKVQHPPHVGARAKIDRRLPPPPDDVPLLLRPEDIGHAEWEKGHEYAVRRARAIAHGPSYYGAQVAEELTRFRFYLTFPEGPRRDLGLESSAISARVLAKLAFRSWLGDQINLYRAAQHTEQRRRKEAGE